MFSQQQISGGGVCISLYDREKENPDGPIEVFTPYPILNSIRQKVEKLSSESLSTIISSDSIYHLSDQALLDHPEISTIVSKGHDHDIRTNAFTQLKNIIFFETKPDDTHEYVQLLGLYNRQRKYFWIRRDYLQEPESFLQWKVFLPQSNGSGNLGETLSTPLIGTPLIGSTQTFLSIGGFSTQEEAENCFKYIKTKFARVLLSILKITQANTRNKWWYVPLQDFTSKSPIHWKESVSHINQQFYTYYGLTEEEQQFIESHVKEMD